MTSETIDQVHEFERQKLDLGGQEKSNAGSQDEPIQTDCRLKTMLDQRNESVEKPLVDWTTQEPEDKNGAWQGGHELQSKRIKIESSEQEQVEENDEERDEGQQIETEAADCEVEANEEHEEDEEMPQIQTNQTDDAAKQPRQDNTEAAAELANNRDALKVSLFFLNSLLIWAAWLFVILWSRLIFVRGVLCCCAS